MTELTHFQAGVIRKVIGVRPQLLQLAKLQLRNANWADDAVAQTIVAAIEHPDVYRHWDNIKPWLIGILQSNVRAQLSRHSREALLHEVEDNSLETSQFDDHGRWRELPADWSGEPDVTNQPEFLDVLEACLGTLPAIQARCFMMLEWQDLSADEASQELGITRGEFLEHVRRARMRLREAIQSKWFDRPASTGSEQGLPASRRA